MPSSKMGIDQSLRSTGVYIVDSEGNHIHEELIRINENDKKDKTYQFLTKYDDVVKKVIIADIQATRIGQLVMKHNINSVSIEGLSFGGTGNATRDLAMIQGAIVKKLIELNVQIQIVAPNSLKKFVTGSGRGSKEAVFDALPPQHRDIVGVYLKSKGRYDLADAAGLALHATQTKEEEITYETRPS